MIKQLQLLSCIGILILEKIIHAMVAPLLSEWDWVTTGQQCNEVPCAALAPNATILPKGMLAFDGYLPGINTTDDMEYISCVQLQDQDCVVNANEPQKLSGFVAAFLLIQPITNSIFSPLSGFLGDKQGYDVALLLGLLTSVVVTLLFALFTTFPALFSANLLIGIAGALNSPNSFAKLNDIFPPDSNMGKTVLGLAMTTNVFSFIAPVLVGVLYEYVGQLVCFLTLLLPLQLLLLLATSWTFYTVNYRNDHDSEGSLDHGGAKANNFEKEEEQENPSEGTFFQIILHHPKILLLSAAILVAWIPRKCIEASLAVWMFDTFQSGPSHVGIVLGSGVVGVLAANTLAAWFNIHFPRYVWIFISLNLVFGGVAIAVLGTASSMILVSFYIGVYIFFACSTRYAAMGIMSLLAETISTAPRSKVMSIANIGMGMPNMIGPIISISVYDYFGFHVMCLVAGIPCIVYGMILLVIGKYSKEVRDTTSARYIQLPQTPNIATAESPVQPPLE